MQHKNIQNACFLKFGLEVAKIKGNPTIATRELPFNQFYL